MRTTNEIICAVKDCQPATDEELRLALVAMSGMYLLLQSSLYELAEAVGIDEGKTGPQPLITARLRAHGAKRLLEDMFRAAKTPPDKWLGPAHTPGTPENKEQVRMARAVFKAATGREL
jgi:hypothetical protein